METSDLSEIEYIVYHLLSIPASEHTAETARDFFGDPPESLEFNLLHYDSFAHYRPTITGRGSPLVEFIDS